MTTPPQPRFEVALPHGRAYPYFTSSLSKLPALLTSGLGTARPCLLITDTNVASHYQASLAEALTNNGWPAHVIVVPAGESSKSFGQLESIFDQALDRGIDRQTPVLALGGGVVGDLAGYAAASLLRGLPLVHLPTTLISQVDSAIGGKTGINHTVGKNLIGAFYQPRFVCADPTTLHTLSEREWTSGLAEMLKHALIADAALLGYIEGHWSAILARDAALVASLVPRAAAIKAQIVAQDEHEKGLRAILNFGHTFGHAIEKVAGYGTFTHGEAVALGMQAALYLSHRKHSTLPLDRLVEAVRHIPTPTGLTEIPTEHLIQAMYFDKKMRHGQLHVVLLAEVGQAYVTADVTTDELFAAWTFAKSGE